MRVVAGSAGGIRLTSPRSDIRPTMDRVKGAIFSSLAEMVPGARVLDLFAGTGALGIEALSRGAERAVFVDRDAKAIAAIQENLRKTQQRGDVVRADVMSWLAKGSGGPFDLVLADPPYRKDASEIDLAAALLTRPELPLLVADGGVFVLEHAAGPAPEAGEGWEWIRSRDYGSTAISLFRPKADHP